MDAAVAGEEVVVLHRRGRVRIDPLQRRERAPPPMRNIRFTGSRISSSVRKQSRSENATPSISARAKSPLVDEIDTPVKEARKFESQ